MSKHHFAVVAALLGILVLLHIAPIVAPDRTAPSWEYRIEGLSDAEFLSEMNRIGNAGWELVFARRAISGEGESSKPSYEVIFKRPR